MTGIGIISNPYDLTTALTSVYVRPGDTLWLRGGTYDITDLAVSLAGVAGNPILIKAYQNERAIIDGGLVLNGGYLRFWGIEFTNSNWTTRESAQTGDTPGDITVYKALTANGAGLEFINCIMHNGRHGCAWYGQGGLMYGCLVYHNGWKNPSTPQGHGLYPQNNTPEKVMKRNIVFDNFGWGIHAYSGDADKTNNITLDGNICLNNGSCSGLTVPNFSVLNTLEAEETPTVKNNCTYHPAGENTQNAVGNAAATDVTFTDNYTPEHTETGGVANFLANSGNYDGAAIGNQVFVFANEYDATRAHVAIYNQAETDTVDVDVSAIYANGTELQVHNAQDYFTDIQTLTVTAGVITINMQAANRTVATPNAWTAPAKSFPQFGAFVLVAA